MFNEEQTMKETMLFKKDQNYSINNYTYISVIGKGAFATVILAKSKLDHCYYAIKIMKKKKIIESGFSENILTQKAIMSHIEHPFMVKLKQSFQDSQKLYLIMEYCPGGQLLGLLEMANKLNEQQSRFYSSQIVLVIQSLHNRKIIYRDLKPENILLDTKGYLKIADFGLSKALYNDEEKTLSICGTPQYFAPQMIKRKGHNQSIDWWCLGCLIYQKITGKPPFAHPNRYTLFDKILYQNFQMPQDISSQLKDLLFGLLKKKPEERLGYKGADQIKSHKWFANVNWNNIYNKLIKPPFVPIVHSQQDVSNFSEEFTNRSFQSIDQNYHMEEENHHFPDFDFTS